MTEQENPKPRTIVKINKDEFVPEDIELPLYLSPNDVPDEALPALESVCASLVKDFYTHRYFRSLRETQENIGILRREYISMRVLTLVRKVFSILLNNLI